MRGEERGEKSEQSKIDPFEGFSVGVVGCK